MPIPAELQKAWDEATDFMEEKEDPESALVSLRSAWGAIENEAQRAKTLAFAADAGTELGLIDSKNQKSHWQKAYKNYNRALSSRDAEKYVDGDSDVVDMAKTINDFALIRNQWLGITKGLDQKQWQITNIVKLRVAGMEDANIK